MRDDPDQPPDSPERGAMGTDDAGPPPNWRLGRQRLLVAFLRGSLLALFVVAVAALVLPEIDAAPDDAGHQAAVTMVVLLVAVPAVRILWLLVRWARLGDWRFAGLSAALLGVLGLALVLAG